MFEMRFKNDAGQVVNMELYPSRNNFYLDTDGEDTSWVEDGYIPDGDPEIIDRLLAKVIDSTKELQDYLRSRSDVWQQRREESGIWS